MTYIRNWPEGLFILLVMALPVAAAVGLGRGVASSLGLLAGGMAVGLLVWVGVVWLACRGRRPEPGVATDPRRQTGSGESN